MAPDKHAIYLKEGDCFTVRAQDGARGQVLARYQIAKGVGGSLRSVQIAISCSMCKGHTVVALAEPVIETIHGQDKPRNWAPCPRCDGTGLRPFGVVDGVAS